MISEQASETVHIGMVAILLDGEADLFNYPPLGNLYKYATYDALLQGRAGT